MNNYLFEYKIQMYTRLRGGHGHHDLRSYRTSKNFIDFDRYSSIRKDSLRCGMILKDSSDLKHF